MSTIAETELALLRQTVNCAVVLERMSDGWKLDQRESSRNALKYRRGVGEIIIVNHGGRGWWDPMSTAKGNVFNLVRYLDRSLTFGQVRRVLRGLVGLAPSAPPATRPRARATADPSPAERWASRPRLRPGDAAWAYLSAERALPDQVLREAARQDCIRLGAYGSAWFAHRWHGTVSHVEIRSARFKGSLRGGRKTLFRFGDQAAGLCRLVVLEAPIDALSVAALERVRAGTLYVATGGGMGRATLGALRVVLRHLARIGGGLVSGADANPAGDRYAEQHAAMAADAAVRFERLRPPEGQDWNDVLVRSLLARSQRAEDR